MSTIAVYRQSSPNGNKYWGAMHAGNGEYFITARGYKQPISAVRQIVSPSGNKAYAGRRQHLNSFLNSMGMLNSQIPTNMLKQLVQMQDPNLFNRMMAAFILQTMR